MSAAGISGPPDAPISSKEGRRYWEGVGADVDGMLGGIPSSAGYPYISKVDLQGSRSFLAKLGIGSKNGRRRVANALEGGSGLVCFHGARKDSQDPAIANIGTGEVA